MNPKRRLKMRVDLLDKKFVTKFTKTVIILAVISIVLQVCIMCLHSDLCREKEIGNIEKVLPKPFDIVRIDKNIPYKPTPVVRVPKHKKQSSSSIEENYQVIHERNRRLRRGLIMMILRSISENSERYNINSKTLLGLIDIESSFRINAISCTGAIGLMQINWDVWKDTLRKEGIAQQKIELTVPAINIQAGAYILRHYLNEAARKQKKHLLAYALTRYNGGYKNAHASRYKSALKKHNQIRACIKG